MKLAYLKSAAYFANWNVPTEDIRKYNALDAKQYVFIAWAFIIPRVIQNCFTNADLALQVQSASKMTKNTVNGCNCKPH
jgi:hypothetical protein